MCACVDTRGRLLSRYTLTIERQLIALSLIQIDLKAFDLLIDEPLFNIKSDTKE